MALVKCSECGQSISSKAKTCIHCGCPIEEMDTVEEVAGGKLIIYNGKSSHALLLPYEKNISTTKDRGTYDGTKFNPLRK